MCLINYNDIFFKMNRKIFYDIWDSNCLIAVTVSKLTLLTLYKKKNKFHIDRERNTNEVEKCTSDVTEGAALQRRVT